MKIFISWSGEASHKVAVIFREWLPSVIQTIEPYVSSEDIDKGTRWATDIAAELDASSFGLLCVTKDNIDAPWLNFEAGALGKSIEKSRVCPFLFDIKRAEVKGPILQFQSTINEKDDVLKLLKSINSSCHENRIDDIRLEKSFEVWWPSLEQELNSITFNDFKTTEIHEHKAVKESFQDKMIEEILELSRINQKLLRTPELLMPVEYVKFVLDKANQGSDLAKNIKEPLIDLTYQLYELNQVLSMAVELQDFDLVRKAITMVLKMEMPMEYIFDKADFQMPKSLREKMGGSGVRFKKRVLVEDVE